MSPVDLAIELESASPINSAVVELPVLENQGEDVPLLFQVLNSPETLPECPVDPVVESVVPEYNPEPPAVSAMPVPHPNCARRYALSVQLDLPGTELGSDLEQDKQDLEFVEVQFGTAGVADPCSFKVAMNSAQKDEWWKAIVTEYATLVANDTWTECELPPGKKAIG
ncbi:hypothetical protein H0H92_005640 [Tricholoma furcatifolium]|nr:hypothetical protein H0H92_005640 [Tricholoma furcatifolium]